VDDEGTEEDTKVINKGKNENKKNVDKRHKKERRRGSLGDKKKEEDT
jgi:hypothetical protein